MWTHLDRGSYTKAFEVPGLGCVLHVNGSTCFVPGARIVKDRLVRDDRNAPMIHPGSTAEEILKNATPDPGARQYFEVDDVDY